MVKCSSGSQQWAGCQPDRDSSTPTNRPDFGDGFSRLGSNGAKF